MKKPSRIILIIENDEHVRQLAAAVLEREGFQVFQAAGAKEASSIWIENKAIIDLLLTDVSMPGWSGPEIAKELRMLRPDLKVIFTSGYDPKSISETADLVSNARFISKPYSVKSLTELVRNCLDEPGQHS